MKSIILIITFATLTLWAGQAHAYLDPGTGSMIVSAIVGVLASVGLAIKAYWYKIKRFFGGGKKPDDTTPDASGGDDA